MKNIIAFIILAIAFIDATAQTQSMTTSRMIGYGGNVSDTVIKNGTATFSLYINPFAERTVCQTTLTRIRGSYTKALLIISGSYDFVTWFALDTTLYASSSSNVKLNSGLVTAKYPYLKYDVKPYDSTATLKYSHVILIDKN